jgi:ATP-dependent RNA helicase DDX42
MVVHIYDQQYIEPGVDGPIGVILTPTRELTKQVYQYAKIFIECIGGKAIEVSGGHMGTYEIIKQCKLGCEIIVGSPGRLIDIIRKKGTNLQRVTFLVLDEADRMLDMGFEKQVHSILENIRPDRQTLLLSATFGKRVEKVARSWLRNPVRYVFLWVFELALYRLIWGAHLSCMYYIFVCCTSFVSLFLFLFLQFPLGPHAYGY